MVDVTGPVGLARGPAVEHEATVGRDERGGVRARVPADAVEQDRGAAGSVLHDGGPRLLEPAVGAVVDGREPVGVLRAGERAHERDLLRTARERDDAGPGHERALHEERAEPAGRGGDDDGVRGGDLREVEDADGGAARADHGDRVGCGDVVGHAVQRLHGDDGEPGVPAAVGRPAEVGRDAASAPGGVDAGPDDVHDPRDLAAGDRRQVGQREGATRRLTAAQRRVEQVDAVRADGDADLPGAGLRVGDGVEDEILGRSERVQTDGVHGCSSGGGWDRRRRRRAARSGRALLVSNLNYC